MVVSRIPQKLNSAWRAVAAMLVVGFAGLASAGTFPSGNLAYQTSGQQRAATVGDWYTSTVDGGSGVPGGTDRIHRFLVEITPAQLAANGGSITVTVQDAESYIDVGPCDEVDGRPCDPNAIVAPATVAQGPGAGTEDPTRFAMTNAQGVAVGVAQTFNAPTSSGQTASFTVNAAGFYEITSLTGGTPISGNNTVNLNDDDNAFLINVPFSGGANGGGLGSFQGSFQQDTGSTIPADLYFLVGPSVTGLALRNFDQDCNYGTISYTRPNGSTVAGTGSGNGRWNGAGPCGANNGNIDTGADNVTVNGTSNSSGGDAGVWRYNMSAVTTNNQSIFEANDSTGRRLPAFDTQPLRAGLFTMTPSDVRQTQIGTAVDHGFTVTNLYFTTDIFNFTLSGTSANWTVQLLTDPNCDGSGADGAALTDTDGDGRLDTGVLQPGINAQLTAPTGNSRCFVLRTTPQAGANSSDTTRISAVSFMDNKVDPSSNTTLFVDKTTLIPPRISKSFSANPISANGVSTLTFLINNVNTLPLTAVNFNDVLPTTPAQMSVAAAPAISTSGCGTPTFAPAAGATSLAFSAGTLAASSTCTVKVNVTAPAVGNYLNTSTAVGATGPTTAGSPTLTGNTAVATLSVVTIAAPSITKSFSASPIPVNGTSVLTLTVTNPNNGMVLNGVAVQDTFPTGLVIAATPGLGGTCAATPVNGTVDENDANDANNTINAGDGSLRLVNATLAANASCTITVNVSSAASGTYNNVTGAVSSTNGGTGNTANASLVVNAAPTVAKAFNPATINVNGVSVLTLTLTNPNSSPLTAAAFTDTYLAGLTNTGTPAASTTCGGTVTAAANGNSLALAGGTIPANASCTVMVNVTRTTAGATNNTIPAGGLTTTGGINNTAPSNTATLTATAIAPPAIAKSFNPTTIQNGSFSTLSLVISNPNSTATLTGVAVNDTFPAAITNAAAANPAVNCTNGSTGSFSGGVNGGNTVGFTAGDILPGGSCTITVTVTSTTNGTFTNTTAAVTSTNGGTGATANAALTVQAGLVAPTISKVFSPNEVGVGGISRLTFTINNPNNATLFNTAFTDQYPAGLVNAATPNVVTNCNFSADTGAAVIGGAAGGNTIGLSNAAGAAGSPTDLPASTSCTLAIDVTSTTAGVYVNNTANAGSTAVTGRTTNANAATVTGNTTTSTVTFVRPGIVKSFSPKVLNNVNTTSTLTIVLSNDSDVDFTVATPGFTDTFPTTPGAMTVAATPNATTNCAGGTLVDSAGGALAAGDVGIRLNGGVIPAHGTCTVSVSVTAAVAGTYTNTIPVGNLNTSGGTNAVATTDTLTVPNRPAIAKAFSPTNIAVNTASTLTLTLTNNNATAATAVGFTDTLPTGVTVTGAPSTNCGGTLTSNTTSVTLAGGTIPGGAPGTCTVTVTVTSAASGTYNNTVPAGGLSSSNGTNAAPANATLTVTSTMTIMKISLPAIYDPVNNTSSPKAIPGSTVPYSIQLTNNNNVPADNNSVVIADALPVATTDLCLANPCAAGNPPFTFIQGTTSSTLTFTFTSLASTTDDVSFSNDSGATFTYTPVTNAFGADPAVTNVRFNPKGSMAGNNGSFQIRFLVRVQ